MLLSKKRSIMLVSLSLVLAIFISALSAQPDEAKRKDIEKYLEVSNQKDQFIQMIDLMLEQYTEMLDVVSSSTWVAVREKIIDDLDSVLKLYIPVIDKYYTSEDVKELIKFYESPIGKKMNSVTPLMNEDLFIIGTNWGEKLAEDIMNELIRLGY